MMSNNEELDSHSSTITNVATTPTIVVSPKVAPLLTPGGTKEWLPIFPNKLKPAIGMKFNNLEEGLEFYKRYAFVAGFNTRKSTTKRQRRSKELKSQYILCNKEGYKEKRKPTVEKDLNNNEGESNEEKTSIKRKRLVTRVGCKAHIVIKHCDDNKFIVSQFHEGHTHPLYTPSCNLFQKEGRKMNILHKKIIVDNSKVNIGPVTTFRMMKEIVGGYDNIGASKQDFKKIHRDLKAYIQGSDAQMFVDNFTNKKLMWSAFFFDFEMDEDYCLCRALWDDPLCKKSYALFGDMVSFDTTYQTNRYNMVFTPFIGVDHHKSCITFAAGFIAKEDIVSFEWLFRSFLKAMGGNEPNCMITDQDPAMKIAVKSVFNKTEHRFCMWHIMKKLPDKVEKSIMQEETGFLKKLCACVWHLEIEPVEFEERWNKVLVEYHLEEHEWLGYMYKIRNNWIPAYFRDKENGLEVAKVSEGNWIRTFDVVFNPTNYDTTCSCKLFYRQGIPCRHMIWVWKSKRFETIPEQYMLHRWTTMALKKPIFDLGGNLLEQCANLIDKKKLLNDLWSEKHTCVSLAEGNDVDIQDLVINLQGIRKDLELRGLQGIMKQQEVQTTKDKTLSY
ncbi:protein FAR1-RELATED SEQUENCE 5-like [Chenopodium quinoa]|uniref:protein FAR1-RELATED SEQUENCE 5-like n=1 Tax=Chenopodium quinoa TaxID=63459 RepID=UPI000B770AEC|nr:protein FAR1-RELATED SEQUENCE 5-like [Chenopodium quinoa]